jgi:hypothetical protein
MIYVWAIPDYYPQSLIGEYNRDTSPDRFLFVQGKKIVGQSVPSFTFATQSEALKKYDVLPNSTMIPLVSERVGHMLTRLTLDDVQLIPALIYARGKELLGFSLVNVLHRVASIDHGASNYVFIPGTKQIMKFTRLCFKPNALGSHHIAREAEYNSFILASETVKVLFDTERVIGHAFIPPAEIKP